MIKFILVVLSFAANLSAATLYVDFDGDKSNGNYVITEASGLDREAILSGIQRNFSTPPVLLDDGRIVTMPGLALDVIAGDASQPLIDGESLAIIIGEPPYPHSVGGWAVVGSFFFSDQRNVGYVFPSHLGGSMLNIWQASTHEAGHVLGLSHPPEGYVPGRLMGLSYFDNAAWTLGEYNNLGAIVGYVPEPISIFTFICAAPVFLKRSRK